jgi:alkanesulfonate monooxygenase SsuD/methylene tetrahydromethanopterin reductase-like flavin-dependent oxidoreductase (luciferase family)
VRGLLRGEEIQYGHDGATHPVRLQNLGQGYVDIDHPIPIHVGGFGPRAQTLAGELGDGLITGIPRGGTIEEALVNVRAGARHRGRPLDGFYTSALVNMLLLEPGETLASPRVVAECGPGIMANVHYLVDLFGSSDKEPPAYVHAIWDEYLAFHRGRDASHSHQQLHASHYNYLDPDEARFVTPELIRAFCVAGQPDAIIDQLRQLEGQGLDGVCFIVPADRRRATYARFAREVIARS